MQDKPLEQFIKDNRDTALIVIRKSNVYNTLDHDDIEEAVFCGLWKVWNKFDANKSSLGRYIYIVVNSYVISIARKKIRIRLHEKQYEDDYSYTQSDICDYFTNEQWEKVENFAYNNRTKPNLEQRLVFDKVKRKFYT